MIKQNMQMSKIQDGESLFREVKYPTVDCLEQRCQSGRKLPRKKRKREGGRNPYALALKVHPGAVERDQLPHVVYPKCDGELFSRPSVSTALSGGQDNSGPKTPWYLGRL